MPVKGDGDRGYVSFSYYSNNTGKSVSKEATKHNVIRQVTDLFSTLANYGKTFSHLYYVTRKSYDCLNYLNFELLAFGSSRLNKITCLSQSMFICKMGLEILTHWTRIFVPIQLPLLRIVWRWDFMVYSTLLPRQ